MRFNPKATVWAEQVGGFPVLFIDDVYEDIEQVRAEALAADYSRAMAYYPGLHAPIETADCRRVVATLCGLLDRMGDVEYDPAQVVVDFSIITTPPAKLLAQQQHPHTDPNPIFALVYLTPNAQSSTSFYRNKVTGIHKLVTDEEKALHATFCQAHGADLDPLGYDLSQNPYWERIYSIEAKYNRLVCYSGLVFHGVDPGPIPDPFTMDKARITQRFAFNGAKLKQQVAA